MKNDLALGIDIGGSFVKVALVDSDGELIDSDILPTPQSPPDVAISIIVDDILEFLEYCETEIDSLHGIGVGFPGAIRGENGLIEASPNLKKWHGIELAPFLREAFGRPVCVDNDANAAAFGEYLWGKGKGANPLILFTLGTGIGAGVVIDGRIFRGSWGGASEIGHHSIDMNGRLCTCGNHGCVEAYAGAKGIVARAWELLKEDKGSLIWEIMDGDFGSLDPEIIGEAALKGDETALKITREASRALGVATANIINIFNPEFVLFAGGVSGWGEDILLATIRAEAKSRALKAHFNSCTIELSASGPNCGVLGAAAIALAK